MRNFLIFCRFAPPRPPAPGGFPEAKKSAKKYLIFLVIFSGLRPVGAVGPRAAGSRARRMPGIEKADTDVF